MSQLIPDPRAPGLLGGGALKGQRDALQERVLTQTTWCLYCCCAGCGTDGLDLPCCFLVGEICCCGGTVKATSCYDQDGCIATSSKCCCCMTGFEYPPDNTPGIGCGPVRCMGNLEGRTPQDCSTVAAANELETYQRTLWCLSCYCCFTGITYDPSPICDQQGKLCCLWLSVGSADCWGDDGCIEISGKCCCCVIDGSIPAGYTPGVAICGKSLCCANMPVTYQYPDDYGLPQQQMFDQYADMPLDDGSAGAACCGCGSKSPTAQGGYPPQ